MLEYILLIVGLALLIKGADILVDGASSLAQRLKVSTLIIGLTVVSFGTSLPELFVSVISAMRGTTGIVFGNIVGSNISNILLILGITAIITKLKVKRDTIWKEIPFALLGSVILIVVSNKLVLDNITANTLLRADGFLLILFFAIFIYYVFETALRHRKQLEDKKLKIEERPIWRITLYIIIGLVGLYLGGKWTVDSAVLIAQQFGLSDFLISATIIAIGTSLPELVTSVTAALKRDIDMAVGNIVGSNIFNTFWILGVTAIFAPISIPLFINADLIILTLATLALFAFMFIGEKHRLTRWNGILFVLAYIAYIIFLIHRG